MIKKFIIPAILTSLILLVASCQTYFVDGENRNLALRYGRADVPVETGALFRIGDDYRQSFFAARRQLVASGFEITGADIRTGQIDAVSNDNGMINCGSVGIGPNDDLRVFAANKPVAVIEVPALDGGSTFLRRIVSVQSSVTVRIGADPAQGNAAFASVLESHSVNLTLSQLDDNAEIYNQTIEFSGYRTKKFRRGVICGTAQVARNALLGN